MNPAQRMVNSEQVSSASNTAACSLPPVRRCLHVASLPRALLYPAMLGAAVLLFLVINHYGAWLAAPQATALAPRSATTKPDVLVHVLIGLLAVLVVGRVLGVILRRIGQPAVIGEVLAGIVLGPSLLGRVWPEGAAFVLPSDIAPYLGVIAQLGVILYMFLVGLELNHEVLRGRARAAIAISHASIVVPFLLGAALALLLYPRLSHNGQSFTGFALFLGAAMSITAFPVLARILADRGMQHTPLGALALGCAATDDATAWCLLAFVVGVAQAHLSSAFVTLGLTAGYIAFVLLVVRPVLSGWLARRAHEPIGQGTVAVVLAALLLSALATEAIGIHALFGAFLLGAIIPPESSVARAMKSKLEDLVTVLLLPAFFAFTGLRTQIGLLDSIDHWLLCGLIILVATAGKFGGTIVAARFTGAPWREAAALGLLMNTRGLMELIVLNIGLDLQVIAPTLFAMMVLMALATTLATTPWLRVVLSKQPQPG
jgi:Kef-type K+ transport system membrane component KefB